MAKLKKPAKKIVVFVIVVVAIAATFTPIFDGYLSENKEGFIHSPIDNTKLIVSFLDVGQGDATLILCDDEIILVDTGLLVNYDKLLLSLSRFDIDKIDKLILTHPDSDHCGSAEEVISQFHVEEVIVNSFFTDSRYYKDIANAASSVEGFVSVVDEMNFTVENTIISLASFEYENDNDNSIIALIDYYDFEILLTADISKRVEEKLVLYFDISDIEVLKAAHHGSDSSSGDVLIEAADADYSVISVGDNSFGHPSGEVLKRLQNTQILRTDENGSVTFYFSEEKIALSKEKN